VDQFENLAAGLSSKIWQKIMILDRIQIVPGVAGAEAARAAGQATSAPAVAAPALASR
jgi:hypothetical protein